MSVAVCCASLHQPVLPVATSWLSEIAKLPLKPTLKTEEKKERTQSFDFWDSIQSKKQSIISAPQSPYIHPLIRHPPIPISLDTCTESLGSETGSHEFASDDSFETEEEDKEELEEEEEELDNMEVEKRDLFNVNYHCSNGRSRPRAFPPPLPSISRRDGPCFKMQPRRCDGRLVVVAVPVPSVNYLHAERRGGRLLLSFVDNRQRKTPPFPSSIHQTQESNEKDEEEVEEEAEEEELIMEEEEEEEVEVVDRGTIVEVKVSSQAAVKLHRSSLVINKFVVGSLDEGFRNDFHVSRWGPQSRTQLFPSKRRSWEELLHDKRWSSELRRPLFIYEQPHCIATT